MYIYVIHIIYNIYYTSTHLYIYYNKDVLKVDLTEQDAKEIWFRKMLRQFSQLSSY